MEKILVIDDNADICTALEVLLSLHGYETLCANSPDDGLRIARDHDIALVIQDMNFSADTTSGEEGATLFSQLRLECPDLPIILITAWTCLESAVKLVKSGAADYLAKPWNDDKLLTTLNNLLELSALQRENRRRSAVHRRRKCALAEKADLCGLIYESEAMQEIARLAVHVAPADVPILITGESGVGKERIADIVQANSRVKNGPFIKLNCGALPIDLLEAELFGAEAGAYTGASKARLGRFELADGGTLFLDEIGNLPLSGQMKLLRVLQSGEFERLGSGQTRKVSVRVISATNSELKLAIKHGLFREDLYFRLNVIELAIPPLRLRRDDILPLARAFLGGEYRLSRDAEQALQNHIWPGNVRELENALVRAKLLANSRTLQAPDLGLPALTLREPDIEPDEHSIRDALTRSDGVVAHAAKELGLSRQALYRRMEKFGIAS